ncbi:MAG TPA: T9SS type A sorting domain-containing protein, partial [Bacteroidales bacterium]|nr:T9SS type A sorting domain-containing protein [Bacteroidales bacterium]
PVYQWMVNGVSMGTNQSTLTYTPVNHDQVSCVVTSNLPCATNNPATSSFVVMTVSGVSTNITVIGSVDGGETMCYNSSQTMIVAGNGSTFTVYPDGNATMIAGKNIRYLPGTRAMPGSYMHGYISNVYCGQKASTIVMSTPGEQTVTPVEPSDKSGFRIYPNPTNGTFTLEQTGGRTFENVHVEIYGMRGDKVMTGEMREERSHPFHVNDLPEGLYFVKVAADGYGEIFKLVKTR